MRSRAPRPTRYVPTAPIGIATAKPARLPAIKSLIIIVGCTHDRVVDRSADAA